jgi:hypothetical protein
MNIGLPPNDYLISPEYLLAALQANRDRGVMGEAYFYYEGFRKNNNQLGDTLKATFYSQSALVPGRNGNIWRPKATIKNEDETGVTITGNWTNYPMQGFTGQIIRTNQTSSYASVEYNLAVPFSAYFDVYAYLTPNTTWTEQGRYVLYSETDSSEVIVNQSNLNRKGWQKIGTVYLSQGNRKVMKIDNTYLESGRYLVADAMMIMINRKLSPDVVVTDVEEEKEKVEQIPREIVLEQNYPNPFNPSTTIGWESAVGGWQTIKLYDVLGREIDTIVEGYYEAGKHFTLYTVHSRLPSGVYFYKLTSVNHLTSSPKGQAGQSFSQTKKMILLR